MRSTLKPRDGVPVPAPTDTASPTSPKKPKPSKENIVPSPTDIPRRSDLESAKQIKAQLKADIHRVGGSDSFLRPGEHPLVQEYKEIRRNSGNEDEILPLSPSLTLPTPAERLAWRMRTKPSTTLRSDGCVVQKGFVVPDTSTSNKASTKEAMSVAERRMQEVKSHRSLLTDSISRITTAKKRAQEVTVVPEEAAENGIESDGEEEDQAAIPVLVCAPAMRRTLPGNNMLAPTEIPRRSSPQAPAEQMERTVEKGCAWEERPHARGIPITYATTRLRKRIEQAAAS